MTGAAAALDVSLPQAAADDHLTRLASALAAHLGIEVRELP